jgi:hypothetical protein
MYQPIKLNKNQLERRKTFHRPGMVAQVCNPSYLRGRDRRITVQSEPRQKVSKTPVSNNNIYNMYIN